MNGECRCRKGTYGMYCQYKESDSSSVLATLFYGAAFLVIGVLILALFYGAYIYLKRIVSCFSMVDVHHLGTGERENETGGANGR